MPTPAILLLSAALLPLAAFLLLVILGRRMGTLAGYVATGFTAGSFILSILAMISWYSGAAAGGAGWGFGRLPIDLPIRWIPIGTPAHPSGLAQDNPGWLDIGIYIDSLTIMMFAMITLLATLVHVYSVGYMKEDGRYSRFFAGLGLFCFSMLGMVLGATLLHILIFWELAGFCSYLMIAFWFEQNKSGKAALKAFITNRVGDVGLLIGIGILVHQLGNLTLPHLWLALGRAGTGQSIQFGDGTIFTSGWLTAMGIALAFGAIGRSAQFPLHAWLADAMEAPTPASALIHGAVLVSAGVYLLARIFPILTPDAKLFIAVLGTITLVIGALMAIAQSDIKKVLAFSTMSQLGYMLLAMGVGSWVGGVFHLMTHAFFNALLFLGAGSAIGVAHQSREMGGGLMKIIPVTATTFMVGVLAISGVGYAGIGLSGYYSKAMILSNAGAYSDLAIRLGHSRSYLLLYYLPLAVSYLIPFYMMRCWMLTFWGKQRCEREYDDSAELPIMWGALLVLAALAVLSGRMLSIKEMLEGSLRENNAYCRLTDANFCGFDTIWPGELPVDRGVDARGVPDVLLQSQAAQLNASARLENYAGVSIPVWGLIAGFVLYYRGPGPADVLLRFAPLRHFWRWLGEQMYFDELYFGVFATTLRTAGAAVAWMDRTIFGRIGTIFR
jgi:proton-translocating NADH-quinone oxidoreductase chain L